MLLFKGLCVELSLDQSKLLGLSIVNKCHSWN